MNKITLLTGLLVALMGVAFAFNPPSGGLGWTGEGSPARNNPGSAIGDLEKKIKDAFATPGTKDAEAALATPEGKEALAKFAEALNKASVKK